LAIGGPNGFGHPDLDQRTPSIAMWNRDCGKVARGMPMRAFEGIGSITVFLQGVQLSGLVYPQKA
jgi:hypothetical protein